MAKEMLSSNAHEVTSTAPEPHGLSFWPHRVVGMWPVTDSSADPVPLRDPDREAHALPRSALAQKAEGLVTQSFVWLSNTVNIHLSQLEADLAHEDGRTLSEELFLGVLRVALAAISGGVSERVSSLVATGALKEVYKSTIRASINEGIAAGAQHLRSESKREALGTFVRSHQAAVLRLYESAQTAWVLTGSDALRTDEQASAILSSLSGERVKAAVAQLHYDAVHDAWLAYLAQSKFGTIDSIAISEDGAPVKTGHSTDMTSTEKRERANFEAIDQPSRGVFEQERGPELHGAFLGVDDGVLVVEATLPNVAPVAGTGLYGMSGRAMVDAAYLNGVSERIRNQFGQKPLSTAKIPRLIICKVDGDYDDFEVRVNEKGIPFDVRSPWLAARAAVEPGNLGKDPASLREIGIALLLNDLVPTNFRKGTSE